MLDGYSNQEINTFQERLIAYVDLLGFSEIVEKIDTDEIYREKIIKIVNFLAENSTKNSDPIDFLTDKRCTHFSDCLVISYPGYSDDDLNQLILDVIILQNYLLEIGIAARGGITIGNLYHKGSVLVGSGMVEAYTLEEKIAIYPRVIVSRKAMTFALGLSEDASLNQIESWISAGYQDSVERDNFESRICKDIDGHYFVDNLKVNKYSYPAKFDQEFFDEHNAFLMKSKNVIESNLALLIASIEGSRSNITRNIEKWKWYVDYYNRSVLQFRNWSNKQEALEEIDFEKYLDDWYGR